MQKLTWPQSIFSLQYLAPRRTDSSQNTGWCGLKSNILQDKPSTEVCLLGDDSTRASCCGCEELESRHVLMSYLGNHEQLWASVSHLWNGDSLTHSFIYSINICWVLTYMSSTVVGTGDPMMNMWISVLMEVLFSGTGKEKSNTQTNQCKITCVKGKIYKIQIRIWSNPEDQRSGW